MNENSSEKKFDTHDRETRIKDNMALVGFVAGRFTGRGYDYEDLYQYGCIGLIKAVDRFDPDYGVAFSTYAVPLIIGEIKRFLRSDGSVHISRTIRENAFKILNMMQSKEQSSENMSISDVSNSIGLSKYDAILAISSLKPVRSLSEPLNDDEGILLQDVIGKEENTSVNDNIAIKQAMDTLTEDERELIRRRYYMRHTQTAIAGDMGLSQVQISRMEKKVLLKLRGMLL